MRLNHELVDRIRRDPRSINHAHNMPHPPEGAKALSTCTTTPNARDRYRTLSITCPYTSDKGWRSLRDEHPEQCNEAVAFDRAIRAGSARANAKGIPLRGQAYLHPSLKPLDEAPIDLAHVDRKFRHLRLVDVAERWEGDPDGCSPWACRSGSAVASAAADEHGDQGRRAA